ncbi:hypothetical protein RMCBS344292_10583 [Rhizopus microsporus]|nr:hypothetical protein RMCBS344292_10583 [Rhizopus microsporus]
MLLCADYYADWNTTGQTGLIDVSDWHVDFPQPLPNEQSPRRTEYFSQYCRIVMLRKMELFRTAYMLALQSPQEALFSGLDEQLFQTYFNTPNAFNINLNPQTFLTQAWTRRDIESLLLNDYLPDYLYTKGLGKYRLLNQPTHYTQQQAYFIIVIMQCHRLKADQS